MDTQYQATLETLERLREESVAQEMQVSRTPVRAALARLEEAGLLVAASRGTEQLAARYAEQMAGVSP